MPATAIQALDNGTGKDPLDALDKLAEASLVTANAETDPTNNAGAARAAKLIALDSRPLGISAADFDPSERLRHARSTCSRCSTPTSSSTAATTSAPSSTASSTRRSRSTPWTTPSPPASSPRSRPAQRPDGSWDYTGTPAAGPGGDVDTTSLALVALASSGLTTDRRRGQKGVQFLAANQQANGSWQAFGTSDPNSTSTATVALSDLRIDPTTSAWRTTFGTPATGTYVSPQAWLRTQQAANGHITSPNDSPIYGTNTFATTQTIQALSRQVFLTYEREAARPRDCRTRWPRPPPPPIRAATMPTAGAPMRSAPTRRSSRPAWPPPPQWSRARTAARPPSRTCSSRRSTAASTRRAAGYWSTKLITLSRPEVLSRLTGSSEYFRKAGGTIPTFVDAVYQSVLGRAADPSGRAYWIGQLNQGKSVERVARSLVASSEYRRHAVNDAFERVLDRAAHHR